MPTPIYESSSSCPFCAITAAFSSIPPSSPSSPDFDPTKNDPPSFVVLSTEDVVAFLDIAPLTRGHLLVAPRQHVVKMGDLSGTDGAKLGRVLPVLARSVMRAVFPDIPLEDADYNIVQNNGPGAAQIIPHLHFHIIPRPPLNYSPSMPSVPTPKPAKSQINWIQFGRGQRSELDEDDAEDLAKGIREYVAEEWSELLSENDDERHERGGENGKAKL